MSTLMPPKEIIKNIRIHNGFVYLIGDVTEEQKKIFREFKKYVDEDRRKSRVEIESDDSFSVERLEGIKRNWIKQSVWEKGKI